MATNIAPTALPISEIFESREVRDCLQGFTRDKQWINEMHLQLCRIPAPTFLKGSARRGSSISCAAWVGRLPWTAPAT